MKLQISPKQGVLILVNFAIFMYLYLGSLKTYLILKEEIKTKEEVIFMKAISEYTGKADENLDFFGWETEIIKGDIKLVYGRYIEVEKAGYYEIEVKVVVLKNETTWNDILLLRLQPQPFLIARKHAEKHNCTHKRCHIFLKKYIRLTKGEKLSIATTRRNQVFDMYKNDGYFVVKFLFE